VISRFGHFEEEALMSRQSSAEKRSFWQMAVQLQEESGLSVARFCEREELKPATFYGWRRRLQREASAGHAGPGGEANSGGTLELVPVRVLQDEQHVPVEVVSPSGFIVRVAGGAEIENVRRVLQLVQGEA
jgi:transposase-like protein